MNNNGNGHKIQLRCECCNKLLGEFEPDGSILTIKCSRRISNGEMGHPCATFNAFKLKQPQLIVGSRVLYSFGTALN